MADVYSIIIIVVITRVVHNHIPLCSVNIIQRDEKYTEYDDNWERSEWKVLFCHLQAMTKWWHKSVNFQLHNSSLFRNPSQSLPFFSSPPLSSPVLLKMPWKMTEFMSHHAGEWEKALIVDVDGSLKLESCQYLPIVESSSHYWSFSVSFIPPTRFLCRHFWSRSFQCREHTEHVFHLRSCTTPACRAFLTVNNNSM